MRVLVLCTCDDFGNVSQEYEIIPAESLDDIIRARAAEYERKNNSLNKKNDCIIEIEAFYADSICSLEREPEESDNEYDYRAFDYESSGKFDCEVMRVMSAVDRKYHFIACDELFAPETTVYSNIE